MSSAETLSPPIVNMSSDSDKEEEEEEEELQCPYKDTAGTLEEETGLLPRLQTLYGDQLIKESIIKTSVKSNNY